MPLMIHDYILKHLNYAFGLNQLHQSKSHASGDFEVKPSKSKDVSGDFSERIPAGIPHSVPHFRGIFPRGDGEKYSPCRHSGAGIGEVSPTPWIPRPP
ncbi:hypothetical protein MTR_2g028720 [Medicago truncatula]|uniref:Uncharacterized protein n=1 Tax=Medicago truncatula TaxID=3880 RepID=G7IFU3_MEDTR|nr:hypothetical protein MTR_2g028720 [Medicago truncatula]